MLARLFRLLSRPSYSSPLSSATNLLGLGSNTASGCCLFCDKKPAVFQQAAIFNRSMGTKIERHWLRPEGCPTGSTVAPGSYLMLYNSLLDEKVPFVPVKGKDSKQVSWYICGPTVYDAAHMGHARNYVTFDILRRVLEDYFGYNVQYVMNVTDVDDKIILRARRNHLLEQYRKECSSAKQVYEFATEAVKAAATKQRKGMSEIEGEIEQEEAKLSQGDGNTKKVELKLKELRNKLEDEKHKHNRIVDTLQALAAMEQSGSIDDILRVASDHVAAKLDEAKKSTVTDMGIFRAHADRYEREFMEDMDSLGCRRPRQLTRVSEYVPEIIDYIKKIIDNGMAYEANGSVYFNTTAFTDSGHRYAKLKPWAVGNTALASESEANFDNQDKRNRADFALWKASKAGEPFWDSPWGKGRPGWHIECSAMASKAFGGCMDIHTGGEDLRFPHHDNELAQAEAHYHHEGCHQWVNYFLHSGHLEIEGRKMSKSLKNFITIREALNTFSARQLRLLFVLHPWNKPMMYSEQTRGEVTERERQLKEFFHNVKAALREAAPESAHWKDADEELQKVLLEVQEGVHLALTDNIDTSKAMEQLSRLITNFNKYYDQQKTAVQPELVNDCAAYVTRILAVFGLVDTPADKPGLSDGSSAGDDARTTGVLNALAAFRDEIRALCRRKAEARELLEECDKLRDEALVKLGVRLEDRPEGQASIWKLDDPAVLQREIEERARQKARQAAETVVRKAKAALDAKEKEFNNGQTYMKPIEQGLADKFSAWDAATGMPTMDEKGKPIAEKLLAPPKGKVRVTVEKYRQEHAKVTEQLAANPQYFQDLEAQIGQLKQALATAEASLAEIIQAQEANGNGNV